ncbi:MAG TPA: GNAT family N-acetyltransferase [Thermomicrobiales bacterium]|jgi:RimJ/RimL family protein N-acetyltransferase|nr:GNAT family N-acetyltransferase [Chloroflexota bacterium]HBY46696.1 GNAT family N-acetyltransferase [Chloroflexota bacterium]HCG29148.1 GNAT family N-acetyltransferase [Chloroflexota bacterium]HQZ91143.1 GNAT family N-acetyltransferase [Thermomicrobiales bacterium]HRA32001.1 GNAT family N-acetyltransferase [Thermomicrobiales bacterium]
MHVYLETERLILRRFTPEDVELLVELDADPEVMRYLSGGQPTPREAIERDIMPAWLRHYERGNDLGFWAAIEKESGAFLGWFHFRPTDEAGEVELGYRLRRAAWGKGYATEGSQALIDKGFRELGIQRVVASTYQDNVGSRRVMEKLGMTHVRTFRMSPEELSEDGIYDPVMSAAAFPGDDVEYALDRADWERQQPLPL